MSLKPLSQIAMPNFVSNDMLSLKDDIIAKIRSHPDWNNLWDGELYQNSFQMILLLFTYLFERNAQSFNMLIREKFVNQAFSPKAIYDNLSDMRISLRQNTVAEVTLTGIADKLMMHPVIIPRFFSLNATNKNNQIVKYEIINYDENEGYKYYDNVIIFPNSSMRNHFTVKAYSGTTISYKYEITPSLFENFKIQLNVPNIIEDSIQAYYVSPFNPPIQLIKTNTFIVEPVYYEDVFPKGIPHFIVKYNFDGSAELLFGSEAFGGAFNQSHTVGFIEVFCRTGGGSAANILAGGINQSATLMCGGSNITVRFFNEQDSSIAVDREDIYIAKQFAAYRFGRDKAIIDKIDAKSKISHMVVKHEIETPVYNDLQSNVQLLHAYHYIVPKRDFSLFRIPNYIAGETLAQYVEKFISKINDFCNVQGTHDFEIKNEYVTPFVNSTGEVSTYSYMPKYKYPLSASLRAYAYDYANRIVDSITWNCNYPVDQKQRGFSLSNPPNENAKIYSNPFDFVIIINQPNINNSLIRIRFDYEKYSYIFNLQVLPRSYTYIEYANTLQNLIIQEIINNVPEMYHLRNFQFVTYEQINGQIGRIIFNSPSTGEYSSIQILDNGTPDNVTNPEHNIYLFLGLQKKIYRPSLETGRIFLTSQFKYEDNVIDFNIRTDKNNVVLEIPYNDLNININHSIQNGPFFEKILYGENNDQLEQLIDNSTIHIKAIKNNNVIDYLIFNNISKFESETIGSLEFGTGIVFKNPPNKSKYIYDKSKLIIQFCDNVLIPVYKQSYPTIHLIEFIKLTDLGGGNWVEDDSISFKFFEVNNNYTQDPTSNIGKTVTLQLTQQQNLLITIGSSYRIKLYEQLPSSGIYNLLEQFDVYNIISGNNEFTNPYPIMNEVCIDRGSAPKYFDKVNGKIVFKLLDPILDPTIEYYDKGFVDFDTLKIEYSRKMYEYITIDYKPNPYRPEGEAAAIIKILGSKSNRMIGLEQLIKRVNFIPRGAIVELIIKRGFPLANAIQNVKNILLQYFGYHNNNYNHKIGSIINNTEIRNVINLIANDNGILEINIKSLDNNQNYSNYTYFFLLDQNIYDQLVELEQKYPELSGLSDLYKVEVTALPEDLVYVS